jgi:hypothetical protein
MLEEIKTYALGVLLLVCAALGVAAWLSHAHAGIATGPRDSARGERDRLTSAVGAQKKEAGEKLAPSTPPCWPTSANSMTRAQRRRRTMLRTLKRSLACALICAAFALLQTACSRCSQRQRRTWGWLVEAPQAKIPSVPTLVQQVQPKPSGWFQRQRLNRAMTRHLPPTP